MGGEECITGNASSQTAACFCSGCRCCRSVHTCREGVRSWQRLYGRQRGGSSSKGRTSGSSSGSGGNAALGAHALNQP